MSQRTVKYLLAQKKDPVTDVNKAAEEEEEDEKPHKATKMSNLFGGFDDNDKDGSEDSNDSDNDKSETKPDTAKTAAQKAKSQKRNRNKKKNKAKAIEEVQPPSSNKNDPNSSLNDFEILKPEEEKSEEIKEEDQAEELKEDESDEGCLHLNPKLFNYNKEISKYFKNAKFNDSEEGMPKGNKKEMARIKMMKNAKHLRNLKSFVLVHNEAGFFTNPDRFTMEVVSTNQYKMRVFVLQPTSRYASLQEAYESLKETHDPQNIFDFLHTNPYHIDALYDMAEFFRLRGDFKQANELLERVLYVFEDSFGFDFKIFRENDVMLSFDHNQHSRIFFMAVSRFIDILGKKGCYRSAFEFNKFLVKLNPYHDPVGGLLTLDYNAISSKNFEFLFDFPHKFGEQYYKSKNFSLAYLPNYVYSCALAKFLYKMKDKENAGISEYATVEAAELKNAINTSFDHLSDTASTLLMHAILLYPKIIKDIATVNEYAKLTVALGGDKFINWQKKSYKDILNGDIFNVKNEPLYACLALQNNSDIEGLDKIMEIYVERSKILWKNNQVALWAKSCLGTILNAIETKEFKYEEFVEELYTAKAAKILPFEVSRYKGLVKHNFSDHVDRLDLNNIQDNIPQEGDDEDAPGRTRHIPMAPLNTNQGFLGLLLGSLLPWNQVVDNPNPPPANNEDHQHE
jgi:hypothetical protein